MKNLLRTCTLGVALLGVVLPVCAAGTNNIATALQQGLFEEEANNNLEAAIQAYKSVIGQFDRDRKLAATAIYRLGECYRKQGKTNDAVFQYQRVSTEFADISALATLSRENLAGLGTETKSRGTVAGPSVGKSSSELMTSQEEEEIKRIRALIQNSPDLINAPDTNGYTPLHSAAIKGQPIVARFLLENGANVDALAKGTDTPLHMAALNGHKAIVQLLLDHKANVNAAEVGSGKTALHLASSKGFLSVVEVLAGAGAAIDAPGVEGATSLYFAAGGGHYAVAEFLLAHKANVNATTKDGETPLWRTAGRGHSAMARLLLKNGAAVNAHTIQGTTPLEAAVQGGHLDMAKLLLENKADPNLPVETDREINFPLNTAVYAQAADMALLLLRNGADPNAENSQSQPGGNRIWHALEVAIYRDAQDIVPILLTNGANPNLQSKPEGSTALILAVRQSKAKSADLLLKVHADVNLRDSQGNTALHYSLGQDNMFKMLLATKPDVDATNNFGETPLHWAASSGLTNVAAELIKAGANLNVQTIQGWTPLHEAVIIRNAEMLQLLLSRGADPNFKDQNGLTPLELASKQFSTVGRGQNPSTGISVYRQQDLFMGAYPGGLTQTQQPVSKLAGILKQHGALEVLPDPEAIQIGRNNDLTPILKKGTNDWNRFTLIEALGLTYGFLDRSPAGSQRTLTRLSDLKGGAGANGLEFPELSRVRIERPVGSPAKWASRVIDIAEVLKGGDCTKDAILVWGDVIKVPEADHVLNEPWTGLSRETFEAMNNCWKREITVVIKGKRNKLNIGAEYEVQRMPQIASRTATPGTPAQMEWGEIIQVKKNASLWIRPVLNQSKLLLASSDLSRIKVIRMGASSGAETQYVLDCSDDKPAPDFWLQNGDVIEVPDKEP